jgi:hypothetical protein
MLQFDASIFCGELPIGLGRSAGDPPVWLLLPREQGAAKGRS